MYVTHVITRLIVGGAQENTISTVLGLKEKPGIQVDLISGPTSTTSPEGSLERTLDVVPGILHIEPHLVRQVSPWLEVLAFRNLKRRFKETRPDIVHTHSGKAGIIGRMAASAAGVPCIIHGIHGPSFGPFQGAISNKVFLTAERMAGQVTDHFVGVADAMCRQYLDAGIGTPDQYSTVYSGFDLSAFLASEPSPELKSKYGIKPDDFVVGKIARLFELKGHDQIFEVFPEMVKQIPNIKLLLVGGGPFRERFETQLEEMGLRDRVVFTGLVPPCEVPGLVGIMDALVHLSQREGLPRALPQAMAAGKPVISLNLDGAPEVCITGTTGYLLKEHIHDHLIQSLVELQQNPELRRNLGEQGRELVRKRFAISTMVDEIESLYWQLNERKKFKK